MTSFLSSIGKKKKSPDQLVLVVKDSLQRLHELLTIDSNGEDKNDEKKAETDQEQLCLTISKALVDMKNIFYGEHDLSATATAPTPRASSAAVEEEKIKELAQCLQTDDVMVKLVRSLTIISFESRKDTTLIFNHLVKRNLSHFADYLIASHLDLFSFLIHGYHHAEIAFHCGVMIRESIKHYHEVLRYILLVHPQELVYPFIDQFLHLPNFDIASDGFNTFKEFFAASLLSSSAGSSGMSSESTSHNGQNSSNGSTTGGTVMSPEQIAFQKQIINEFLEVHGNDFLAKYEILLRSENYVTRRRSLKLLGELLLDRSHYSLMIRYVSSTANLKTIMHLLRNRSPHITYETFHIFKIFVANPNKPPEIASILFNNKVKLIAYLENFQNDRKDAQFIEEKRLLIETLQQLNDPYENGERPSSATGERGIFSRVGSKQEDPSNNNLMLSHEIDKLTISDNNSSNHPQKNPWNPQSENNNP